MNEATQTIAISQSPVKPRRGGRWKHGHYKSREYTTWISMKSRCLNPNEKSFKDYGGRGIKICERWLDSFENFFADMGRRPPGMTLDRKDANGNYEPGNCKWSTSIEQKNNMRRNINLTFEGQTMTAMEWSRVVGVSCRTLYHRILAGWPVEKILATAPKRHPLIEYQGRSKSIAGWAREFGVAKSLLQWRLAHGFPMPEAATLPACSAWRYDRATFKS